MNDKEFGGNIQCVVPSEIVNEQSPQELDGFFLVLGTIYNDLKGLLLFSNLLRDSYRAPFKDELSPHAGEYGGVTIQIYKLLVSLVSEFLIFIKKNDALISTPTFKLLEKNLNIEARKMWTDILSVAFIPDKKESSFLSRIAKVRSNVVFHYDQSGTEIQKAYIRNFFKEKKNTQNSKAFYSLGKNMESTRFYYCDAAIAAYLTENLNIATPVDHLVEVKDLVVKINHTIVALQDNYLRYKKRRLK